LIARTWRGAVAAADADGYLEYLKRTGLAAYRSTPGNAGALALQRTVGDRAELLLVSFWESEEAVRAFAGSDPDRAVFYPEDDRWLVDRDEHVDHYVVMHEDGLR
jgi:heme-degrading monooxygenase HmoA